MTLYHYLHNRPHGHNDPVRYLEELHPIGVRMGTTISFWPTYQYDPRSGRVWKGIGQITVYPKTGLIKVWEYQGLNDRERSALLGTASLAFTHKPSKATAWSLVRRKGSHHWFCTVLIPVRDDDRHGELVAANVNEALANIVIAEGEKFQTEIDA